MMMRRSISQIFSSPTPQAEIKLREEQNEVKRQQAILQEQKRERERAMFSTLQGRRPIIPTPQSASQSTNLPQAQAQQTITYLPPRKPRTQMEALPPSQSPPCLQTQLDEFMALQKQMSRDPASRHPMFFTDRVVKRAPNGVVVGEGVGRGYVFEEERRVKEGGGERASL